MAQKFEFPRANPAAAGIDPAAVAATVRDWERKGLEIHSFKLLRCGKNVAEAYFTPYRAEYAHVMYSLSKSFTSTAILFAVQEGLLSPDDSVVSFFPDFAANPAVSDRMKRMTLRHLLSMCTGHKENADFIFGEDDCVSAFLTSELAEEPGGRFSYNTGATFMLSAALQARTGQPLDEFLRPRLFEPLGMSDVVFWEKSALGICYGGFGLYVTTDDIARLGTLYLNKGVFDGKPILDEKLIAEATRKHISNRGGAKFPKLDPAEDASSDIDAATDWGMGYGWQFWRCVPEGVYRGDGMRGQFCVVMPKQDAVLAITAGTDDMQGILNSVWNHLLPGMSADFSPAPDGGQAELDDLLSSRTLPCAEGDKTSPLADKINGSEYFFDNGDAIKFNFNGELLTISPAAQPGGVNFSAKNFSGGNFTAGYGKHIANENNIAASWAWNKNGALIVKHIPTKQAFAQINEYRFDGDAAELTVKWGSDTRVLKGKRK